MFPYWKPNMMEYFSPSQSRISTIMKMNKAMVAKEAESKVKWTPTMEEKLIAIVIRERAYMRTDISKGQ